MDGAGGVGGLALGDVARCLWSGRRDAFRMRMMEMGTWLHLVSATTGDRDRPLRVWSLW
jgi:hypothetical protein